MRIFRNPKFLIGFVAILLVIVLLPLWSIIFPEKSPADESLVESDSIGSDLIENSEVIELQNFNNSENIESIKSQLILKFSEISENELVLIDENENFAFIYDNTGADIFVYEKTTGKVWSNSYSKSSYKGDFYNKMFLSQLFNIRVANEKGNIEQFALTDNDDLSDFNIKAGIIDNNKLDLQVSMINKDVEFRIIFWIENDGLMYTIPKESIKEKGKDSIVGITVMSAFGAAASTEDGYIFYPDGSGSIMNFHEVDGSSIGQYTYSFYGADEPNIDLIEENETQEIFNLMLPVYGIKHTQGGVFAAIVEGSEDADLTIAPSGFQVSGLYRAYFTFNYKIYATQMINGKQSVKIVPDSIATTKTVKLFILSGKNNTYSDMAAAYRNYLKQEKVLTDKNTDKDIPISIDFFMGITENGMFLDNYLLLTTFDRAKEILSDLKKEGIKNIQVNLVAWSEGGYDNVPTSPLPASQLGGNKDLRKLMEYCDKNDIDLYLNLDYVIANKGSKNLNVRNDTVRDYFGNIITDFDETKYLINPATSLNKYINSAFKKLELGKSASFNLDRVGEILSYSFKSGKPTSRYNIAKQYKETLEKIKKNYGKVSVTGGNSYVLKYVDKINNLPSKDSNYFSSDYSVPFYQMVVHSSIDYSSNAGNLNGDLKVQILNWIETGSTPYFVLTDKSPEVLKNTSYTELYSSEYSEWKSKIVDTYKEINGELKAVWNKEIVKHNILSESLKQIEYSDGTRVYLNYSDTEVGIEGFKIEPLSYFVVKG